MAEWLIMLAVVYVLVRMLRRQPRCSRLPEPHGRTRGLRYTRGMRLSPPAAPAAETPLESLQRRFVAGGITVEQYEAELDRLLRQPGGGAMPLDR